MWWKTVLGDVLHVLAPYRCAACDGALADTAPAEGAVWGFCGACQPLLERRRSARAGAATVAPFEFGGPMADAIRRFKYQGRTDLAAMLGPPLAEAAACFTGDVCAVTPVPLHPRRLRERGYNQAAILSHHVARALGVPLHVRWLERHRFTRPQVELPHQERLRNVRGAFRARSAVRGRRLLVVDDVQTTGVTIMECARALCEAGATEVHRLVLAVRGGDT